MAEFNRVATTAERIQEAMRRTGKKQADLVRETGLNKSTISRYIAGTLEPRQAAAIKLARALDVSEMWLWGYETQSARTAEQKKNDDLVAVIAKMRTDPKFLDVVLQLADLPEEQYEAVKNLLRAMAQK